MGRRESYSAAVGAAAFLFALYAAASLLGPAELWGINLAKFLPRWWAVLSLLVGALFLVPSVSATILKTLEAGSRRLESSRGLRRVVGGMSVAGIIALGLLFRVQTYFLGDANLRLNQITHGKFWLGTEAGDFFLHALSAKAILSVRPVEGSVAAIWSYHIISALAGGLFVIGIYRLGRYLVRSQALVVAVVLGAGGMLALFFGYVESYSIIAALLPWIMLAALKVVDGHGSLVGFLVLYLIGAALHPVVLVLGAGPLLMAIVLPRLQEPAQMRKLSSVLIAFGAVGLAGLYLLRMGDVGGLAYYLLPWVAAQGQSVLSYKHLLNLINWLLLTAVSAPVLLAVVIGRRGGEETIEGARRKTFALWTIVPALLFALFFTPHLSGPRDWDLFGLAMWLLVPSLLIAAVARTKDRLPWPVLSGGTIGLLVAVSFVAVNASMERGRTRFVETIEVARHKNLFKEYKVLLTFSSMHPELPDRRLEFAQKAWQEPPYTHADSLFILNALTGLYLDRNDPRQAWTYLSQALRTDSTDLNIQLQRLDMVGRYGQPADQQQAAEQMERMFADNGLGLMNAAVMFMRLGDKERGGRDFEQAFRLDSTNADVLMNYGTYQHQIGNYARSAELLERFLRTEQPTFQAAYYAAESWYQLGQLDRARQHLLKAAGLAGSSGQARMVQKLQAEIAGG